MHNWKAISKIRSSQRPLKIAGRKYVIALLSLLALLIMPLYSHASEHALWLAGKEEAWKLEEQNAALELMISEVDSAKAMALDDTRDVLWIMTKDTRIKSYGFDGTSRLDIDIPLESVQQSLHYQGLVEEYKDKIRKLRADYNKWMGNHNRAFRKWDKKHKLAYLKWKKKNSKASSKKKKWRLSKYNKERKAKLKIFNRLKRNKQKSFKEQLKDLNSKLYEYTRLYRSYEYKAHRERNEIKNNDAALVVNKQDGSLWVGSGIGLLKISLDGKRILESPEVGQVTDVAFDIKEKMLWAAGKHKLIYLNNKAEVVQQIDLEKSEHITDIEFDQSMGELWAAKGKEGLSRFNREGVQTFSNDFRAEEISSDGTNNLWVLGKEYLRRITPTGELLQDIDLEQDWHDLVAMSADVNTNYLWVLGNQTAWEDQYVMRMEWEWVEYPYSRHDMRNCNTPFLCVRHERHGQRGMWQLRFWWENVPVKVPGETVIGHYAADGSLQLGLATELKKMHLLASSGDVYKPTVVLKSPEDQGPITPLQVFKLQVSDVGWGVDPSATQILIDDTLIELNCNKNADIIECTPKTPITALEPVLKISVQDYADNHSETIEASVYLDSDGDGHPDATDTYPEDPDRWQLAKVENLQIELSGTGVKLTWDAHSDQQNLKHYDLYRTGVDGTNPVKLNSEPLEAVTYIDNEVSNGIGYQYRVIATDHKGVQGEEGELTPYFVTYNNTQIAGLTAVRQGVDGLIKWDRAEGFRYQVYRGLENETPTQLAQVTTETFLDNGAKWQNAYKYQIATIADFVNPFTQQPVVSIGPRSTSVLLPALPPLSISIDDAVADDQGAFELVINTPDRATLTGQYLEAVGPVSINVSTADGSQQLKAESSSGRFQLVIPVITNTDWTIVISETTVVDRSAELKFRLIEDTTPPELTIDGPLERSVDEDTLLLSGTAIDKHSGIDSITITSDRFPDLSFGVVQGANGAFSSELPLERGDNHITVQATDLMGNQSSVELTIKRTISLAPEVVIQTPAQGATVYDPNISLSGVVYSSLDSDNIRIVFGDQQIFPTSGSDENTHHFTFNDVVLAAGYNHLVVRAETTVGVSEASVVVQYLENQPEPETLPPPELEITSPNLETTVNQDSIVITGNVSGSDGITLTINGEPVVLVGEGSNSGGFKYQLDFSECNGNVTTLTFVVTDSSGKTTTKTVNYVCDSTAPVITLTNSGLSEAPTVNRVVENPFVLEGMVSDINLAGFSINGNPIDLTPGTTEGTYNFSSALQLPKQQDVTVVLEAWDLADNKTSKTLVINADSPIGIELLSPRNGTEILADTDGVEIEVIARIHQLEAGYQVTMALDGGAAQPMTLDGSMASGVLTTSETSGQHTVTVSVLNDTGTVLASTSSTVSLKDLTQLPLKVDKHLPLNAEKNAKPSSFIALYFNRPIEQNKLQVNVRQTVHAETYDLAAQKGTGFGDIPKPSIVEVHKDMEPVAGAVAYYPTDRYITFHPTERLHYGAYILVDVIYDGEELKRFAFNVEPQPTTVAGVVVDQLRTQLQGITLTLPELGMEAVSDANGNYTFQMRGDVTRTMKDGRYLMIINPGMKNPQFGITETWIYLQARRLNSVSAQVLPMLNQAIPFQHIKSGNAETKLARGNLTLDLSEASLLFPDGTAQGNVHVQLLQGSQLSFPSTASAIPAWMYGVQPSGVAVDGGVGISILMPRLGGNRDYIPPNGTLVAMLGFNNDTKLIEVIGIGEVEDQKVSSVGKLNLQRLDYIGYAMVKPEGQEVLQRYKDGEISSIDILRSELETVEQ